MESRNSELDYCIQGMKIVPPYIEFNEINYGVSYEKKMQFINVTDRPIHIQFKPRMECEDIELLVPLKEQIIASGMSFSITVILHCTTETTETQTNMYLRISEHDVYIPVIIQCSQALLNVIRYIDFGNIVVDGRIASKNLTITNTGLKEGKFKISYEGDKPVKVLETEGTVPPQESKSIPIELIIKEEGKLREVLNVDTNAEAPIPVYLIGELIQPKLHLLYHPKGESVPGIQFGRIYYDSVCVEKAVLYNDCPEAMEFVVILDMINTGGKCEKLYQLDNKSNEVDELLDMFLVSPGEGHLEAYGSVPIFFKFSPTYKKTEKGWHCLSRAMLPPIEELNMNVTIQSVGKYFSQKRASKIEIECTAIVLPIDIALIPHYVKFGSMKAQETIEKTVKFQNLSHDLSVYFQIKTAAFTKVFPERGKIKPQETLPLKISFTPKIAGKIKKFITIDIFGKGTLPKKPFETVPNIIHSIKLEFTAEVVDIQDPSFTVKFVPGLSPLLTNEVGIRTQEIPFESSVEKPYMAMLKSKMTSRHDYVSADKIKDSFIAFPNDRSRSLRPVFRSKSIRSIFTKTARYTYLDTNYQYTKKQMKNWHQVRKKSAKYLRDHWVKNEIEDVQKKMGQLCRADIGMIPQAGLAPSEPKNQDYDELKDDKIKATLHENFTRSSLMKEKDDVLSKPSEGGLKPCPDTNIEKTDCKTKLLPKQLYMVSVGPFMINFGEVCINSSSTKFLSLINCTTLHVLISFEKSCEEVRLSNPLSMILPPKSHAIIPIDFEPVTKGNFYRPLIYKINGFHRRHIIITGYVVNPYLYMNPNVLIIEPYITRSAVDGYHGVVTLTNPLNHAVRFHWLLRDENIKNTTIPFKIHPKVGLVEANSSLDCEVIYLIERGETNAEFLLSIHEGDSMILKCSAQMEPPKVVPLEEVLNLGTVPLNLFTEKILTIRSLGTCHSFFQVSIQNPTIGFCVEPVTGLIPAMGYVHFNVFISPALVNKIDIKIMVSIMNGKSVEFKITGQVESPCVEISNNVFIYKTIPCGSVKSIPFTLTNKKKTRVEVGFNLRGYSDFSICTTQNENECICQSTQVENQYYKTSLKPSEVRFVQLKFYPKEPCAYDFLFPIDFNNLSNVACKEDSTKIGKKLSRRFISDTAGNNVAMITSIPKGHVIATAISEILQVQPSKLKFIIHQKEMKRKRYSDKSKEVTIKNVSEKTISWFAHMKSEKLSPFQIKDDNWSGELKPNESTNLILLFYPSVAGRNYEDKMLFMVKNVTDPVRFLCLEGILQTPFIEFNPPELFIPIAPLGIEVQVEFYLVSTDANEYFIRNAIYPKVERLIQKESAEITLDITFPKGKQIRAVAPGRKVSVPIIMSFKSTIPAQISDILTLVTSDEFRFSVPVYGAVENCLLSCYTLIHRWRKFLQVVITPPVRGSQESEPMPVVCHVMSAGSHSRSTESTFDLAADDYSMSYESIACETDTLDTASDVESFEAFSSLSHQPSDSTNPEMYHVFTLTDIVERWFSVNGFPNGLCPVKIPDYFIRTMIITQSAEVRTVKQTPASKLFYSIIDCLHFLAGKVVAATIKISLSSNPVERANQLYNQSENLLYFLKVQSACVPGVKPEHLLSYEDYQTWFHCKEQQSFIHYANMKPDVLLSPEIFKKFSKRAWTLYLLQLYKALVLNRINLSTNSSLEIPKPSGMTEVISLQGMEALGSNMYSISERILLIWLNNIFELHRTELWKNSRKGIPTKRWIVNFDKDLQDGLVFATAINAYCPFVAQNYLIEMYTSKSPMLYLHMMHNAIRIVMTLEILGLEYDIKPSDIVEPHPVAMVMFCAFLFERLPMFLPRSTIFFNGSLHSQISKQLILSNSISRPIAYKICISGEGADNYAVSHNSLTIPANGKFTINVQSKSRYLFPKNATLQLIPKRISSSLGTPMIFSMETKIHSIKPKEVVRIEVPCYEHKIEIIKIKNFFFKEGYFNVVLKECTATENRQYHSVYFNDINVNNISSFYCETKKIYLEAFDLKEIELHFIPLSMKKKQCYLIVSNENVGDFVYNIIGEVTLPVPMAYPSHLIGDNCYLMDGMITINCSVDDEVKVALPIPFKNLVFEKSILELAKLFSMNTEDQRYEMKTDVNSVIKQLISKLHNDISPDLPKSDNEAVCFSKIKQKIFTVEMDIDHFRYPKTLQVLDAERQMKYPRHTLKKDENINTLIIQIVPQIHGYYSSRLILKSEMDIRVYEIRLRSTSKRPLAILEFETSAQQPITQDIPVINNTKFPWELDAVIIGHEFSGPSHLTIPPESSANYSLCFWPMKETNIHGSLCLTNTLDGMEYCFQLIGHGLHPYPFACYSLNCQARETIHENVEVPNNTLRKLTFLVESSLPFFNGPSTITIPPLCKGNYPLEIHCLFSGHFTGVLNFRVATNPVYEDSDGEEIVDDLQDGDNWLGYVIWASIMITAIPSAPEKLLSITSNILESTTVEILINNPTDEAITLGIEIIGEGLHGLSDLEIDAHSKSIYKLTYSPMYLHSEEGRLIFFHPDVGEFWYSLQLQALPPLPTYLPDVYCQLGKSVIRSLTLRNTCDEEIIVTPSQTDNTSFTLKSPEQLLILPNSESVIQFSFTPSGIQRFKNKMTFSSKQFGDVVYFVQGIGTYPDEINEVFIHTPLTMSNSYTITFLNPTMYDAICKITFTDLDSFKGESHFTLPLDQVDHISMKARTDIQIPVVFKAKHMREYKAKVVVALRRADRKLWNFLDQSKEQPQEVSWTYIVHGIPEYVLDKRQRTFKCQTKKVLEETLTLHLYHCVPPTISQTIKPGVQRFGYQLQVSETERFIHTFVDIRLEKDSWDVKSNIAELVFKVTFKPLITLKANVLFEIHSAAGGVWKLPMNFISTESSPDIFLTIKAVSKENIGQIKIQNPFEKTMTFKATFLSKNDVDFQIIPGTGIIPPKSSNDLRLDVIYTPRNPNKINRAKLLIQAEEYEWICEIQGVPANFKASSHLLQIRRSSIFSTRSFKMIK